MYIEQTFLKNVQTAFFKKWTNGSTALWQSFIDVLSSLLIYLQLTKI